MFNVFAYIVELLQSIQPECALQLGCNARVDAAESRFAQPVYCALSMPLMALLGLMATYLGDQ